MNDVNRISLLMKELEKVWRENPDLRLGQLLVKTVSPKNPVPSLYYLEDDILLTRLKGRKEINENLKELTVFPWKKYPQITRIPVYELTENLVRQFLKVCNEEDKNQILTAKVLMKKNNAPVEDTGWLHSEKERVAKLESILLKLANNREIEVAEIGYRILKIK